MNVLAPCNRGWRIGTSDSIEASKMAVETCFWPLFEVIEGEWVLSYKPKEKLPITEWLKAEGRFRHLFRSDQGQEIIAQIQAEVDERWEKLLERCGES
jgi:pyruvate ferredoxin oxidoreductase beta subunit